MVEFLGERRPEHGSGGGLPSGAPRDPVAPGGRSGARHGDRGPFRPVAERRLQAPQGARRGRPHRAGEGRPRAHSPIPWRAAAPGVGLGSRIRAVLERAPRQVRGIFQGEEETIMTLPTYKTMTITLNRTIPAAPAEVYDAWLDPATPGTPWDRSECEKVILDAKIDGL